MKYIICCHILTLAYPRFFTTHGNTTCLPSIELMVNGVLSKNGSAETIKKITKVMLLVFNATFSLKLYRISY